MNYQEFSHACAASWNGETFNNAKIANNFLCQVEKSVDMTKQLKNKNIMATYYRIDEWNASGTGSKIYFEPTLEDAMKYVSGMREITPQETEGIEHTSIQLFTAETCDMEGWNNSNADQTTPIHFA